MKTVAIVFVIILFQSFASAELKVKLHFSPLANLVYQLDCISGELRHCSQATYQDLWKKEISKKSEDEALIKNWAALMSRYHQSVEFEDSELSPVSGRNGGVQLSTKIRIASFQSANVNEYFSRLDLVVVPSDREKFEEVIRHFYPPFEKWWKKTALPKGKRFAKEAELLLKRHDISKKIKQYEHFYEANLSENYEVHFNLFYRPDSDEPTAGEQIENYSIVEFLPIEKPVERIDVIIHELCHFFYSSSLDEKFIGLRESFLANENRGAKGAYNLLNEALATTLGNGLINKLTMSKEKWDKYASKPQSFYFNYHIDKAAKAILTWMDEWIKDNRTLYDLQFVEKYISSLQKEFGDELTAPKLVLNELVLVSDNKFNKEFRDPVRKTMRASSMYASEGEWSDEKTLKSYKDLPDRSALIIIHPSNLTQLKEKGLLNNSDFDSFKQVLKEKGQLIFGFNRSSKVPAYIISAPSYEDAVKLVKKLGELKSGFSGPMSL